MIYRHLIRHQRQWERLAAAFQKDRLAHAHLFYGPPGSGKLAHAIELAALVNCRQPGENGACGGCPSCAKFKVLQHPNLQLVTSLPRRIAITKNDPALKALKPADIDRLVEETARLAEDPYHKIELDGAQSILINSVRDIRRAIHLAPAEPGWRTYLILDAEKLCVPQPSAANALLKILEEPPSRTLFVLVTDRHHLLLDTIRSRCLGLHFPALTAEQVAGYLSQNEGVDHQQALILAQVTGGNLPQARLLAGENGDLAQGVDELLAALLTPKPRGWQSLVNRLAMQRRSRPQEFAYTMRLLQLWLRDLMVLAQTQAKEQVVFNGRLDELEKHRNSWPAADWGAAALVVDRTLNHLERNINPSLTLANLILDVRQAAKGLAVAEV
ncbi:MAG: hypothetical protein V3W14_07070 [Candidatus Neomarinimicrobiota bacterium]